MRKISKSAAQALASGSDFYGGNTRVIHFSEGVVSKDSHTVLYLHGNIIARRDTGGLIVSTCGWHTRTTFDRLNAIEGVHVCKVKGITHLNGKPWHGRAVNLAEWNASK